MANQPQPQRWKSKLLAALLAIAGTLFLITQFDSTLLSRLYSWTALLHSSPAVLAAVAATLLWADDDFNTANTREQEPTGRGRI